MAAIAFDTLAYVYGEIGELRGTLKLHFWMLALLVAGVLLPIVECLAGLL